jgi:hypothetical protein
MYGFASNGTLPHLPSPLAGEGTSGITALAEQSS